MRIPPILRKRYVLACIFLTSLIYFLVKTGLLKAFLKEQGDRLEDRELEFQRINAHRHIQWLQEDAGEGAGAGDGAWTPPAGGCKNTKQSPRMVVDDRGYLCSKLQLVQGCCDQRLSSPPPSRFVCEACSPQSGCCSSFEHCVSCCMHPDKKSLLEGLFRQIPRTRLPLFLTSKDHFSLCMIKCRTSSSSVFEENKYKHPSLKYCYGLEPKLPFEMKR